MLVLSDIYFSVNSVSSVANKHARLKQVLVMASQIHPNQPRYAELQVTSNFTFLTGASAPEELVEQASQLGFAAIAITDANTLAGVVRAHVAAKEAGMALRIGCRLVLNQPRGLSLLVYPTDLAAYGRLCQLLTLGKRRAAKGDCDLKLHDVVQHHEGLLAIVIPPSPPALPDRDFLEILVGLRQVFDHDRLSIAASCHYGPDDRGHLHRLMTLADHVHVPLVATNDVHYHQPNRRPLQDVLTCIRLGCTPQTAGLRLFANGERTLKSPQEMNRLFASCPNAIARGLDLAQRTSTFCLDQLRYEYPHEVCPEGTTAMTHLKVLTWQGARQRYPHGIPTKVSDRLEHEFALIDELGYAHYFLTVHDIVVFARQRSILCQGRGAAANSAVCYCLDITAVDPDRIDLLFERFVSRERNEPPDIDIDFEHERREEVIQYLYHKYGRHRAALTAEVVTYRQRSAIRDVGKALGLSLDCVDRVAKHLHRPSRGTSEQGRRSVFRELGLDPNEPMIQRWMGLTNQLIGFPRHLSQHVGGFVLTERPLCELVPIENAAMPDRTVIEWDKNDIDAMGMLKVDVLGLGMLTCIRKALDFINRKTLSVVRCPLSEKEVDKPSAVIRTTENGERITASHPLTLANVPTDDPAVYDMICHADTIGVFQIESRAQMSMLPRLRPRTFYDLVIEVAIVRPGPIQGDMVHPYLRRRNKEEPVTYPDERIKHVLEKTLGVPLFQEQVMSLAVVAAGFTPGQADELRRAIAAWKSRGQNRILGFEKQFIGGMITRGYDRSFAQRCFNQIKGFGEYGFPESHAASFALLVYVSSWIKHYEPAIFAAALLNSQPMGFYAPAQIVRDARQHGVVVLPVDVNSQRLGLHLGEAGS